MDKRNKGQISIELPQEVADGEYANLALITHSPAEFIFDFCRVVPGAPKAKIKTRVIIAPMHAKAFLAALQENIRRYEKQFGEIVMHKPTGESGPEFPPPSSSEPLAQA